MKTEDQLIQVIDKKQKLQEAINEMRKQIALLDQQIDQLTITILSEKNDIQN